jgi:hypothetical protein
MGLIFPVMIIENTSFGYAFGQVFRLIRDNWWTTFGVLFVTGLIVYFCTLIVVLPTSAFNIGSVLLHKTKGIQLSLTASIITAVLGAFCHIFYILPITALALCYFNLTETKDATGLMERINQLGNNTDNTNLPQEEY